MDARILLFLVLLGTSWYYYARLVTTNPSPVQNGIASELQINHQQLERKVEGVCKLCKEAITPILEHLSNSTNQTELTAALHLLCPLTFTLKDQCETLVDYYAPLIFNTSSLVIPEMLCVQIGLCDIVVFMSQHLPKNSCEFCHHAFKEALLKLKHPGFQLHVVELLLKACNVVKGSVKNCKTLVLAKAPLIPMYAEQLLKRQEICTLLTVAVQLLMLQSKHPVLEHPCFLHIEGKLS